MFRVFTFALGSSTCAAISSVLKHHSAQGEKMPAWAAKMPRLVATMVAQPAFAASAVFDVLAVLMQVWALRYGSLSVVQPVLSAALIISLGLTHLVQRTKPSKAELLFALAAMAGLVIFLKTSGASAPTGEVAIGELRPGIALAVIGGLFVSFAVFGTRRFSKLMRGRILAAAVAVIYATTAGLMKSVTHLYALKNLHAVLLSWQLWCLIALAVIGLLVNQLAFAQAPLHISLPITASLDPLFSVIIGMAVYDEALRATPSAITGTVVGLSLLLVGVAGISRKAADAETQEEVEAATT